MKKIILTFVLAWIFSTAVAENSVYFTKMKAAIDSMKKCVTASDYKNIANEFERISKIESTEWLPLYYAANIRILLVYVDSGATFTDKEHYLDAAKVKIEKLEEIAPKEAEVQVLKAFMIVSSIGLDPTARGASMYPAYEAALAKANELDPENPRVKYMVLSNEVGKAQWFGQGIEPYCPKLKSLYDGWENHKIVSEIHPSWGKEQVAQLMVSCD